MPNDGIAPGVSGASLDSQRDETNARRDYTIIILLALVFAAMPRLLVFPLSVVHWDESIYTLVARDLIRGILPLSGTFEHKPVMIYYIYAIPQLFLGDVVSSIRVLSIVIGVVGATLLGVFVRLAVTRDLWVIAGATIVYALLSSLNRGLAPHPELIMNTVLLAVWIVLHLQSRSSRSPTFSLILIGALWGVAFQTNYLTAVLLLAFAVDYFLLARQERSLNAALRAYTVQGAVIFLSFLVVCFILIVPVLAWGDIGTYFGLQWQFLSGYVKEQGLMRTLLNIPKEVRSYIILSSLLATYLIFLSLAKARRSGERFFGDNLLPMRMSIYVVAAILAAVASNRTHEKYYLLMLPGCIVLLSFVINSLPSKNGVRAFFCAWMIVFSGLLLEQERFLLKQGAVGFVNWFNGKPADIPDRIARDISETLSPGETIYVYDYQHILYYLTGVTPPTPFALSFHHLHDGFVKAMELDRVAVMTDIFEQQPRFVVVGSDPGDGRYGVSSKVLAERLDSEYKLYRTYHDPIFRETVENHGRPGKRSGEVSVFLRNGSIASEN